MKRLLLLAIVLGGTAALASGQGYTVVIQNAEQESFHYVLDPPELVVFDTASVIFENVLYDYFAREPEAANGFGGFRELAPGEILHLADLSEGKHLLVGFFVVPGERGFPVRVINLQAGGGLDERTYRVFAYPAVITARAGRGRISGYPPTAARGITGTAAAATVETGEDRDEELQAEARSGSVSAAGAAGVSSGRDFFRLRIDNQYEDWEDISTFLSFPAEQSPASFTREQYGGPFRVLPIGQSRHWGSHGTALSEIKVVRGQDAVYIYIATHSALSANLSMFLYLHSAGNLQREGATNRFTLELVPARAQEPGLVVLWEKDREPVIVGSLSSGNFFLEAKIDMDLLYDVIQARPQITFFDLTTSFFDRRELAFEEFYVASIPLAAIPTEHTLY